MKRSQVVPMPIKVIPLIYLARSGRLRKQSHSQTLFREIIKLEMGQIFGNCFRVFKFIYLYVVFRYYIF